MGCLLLVIGAWIIYQGSGDMVWLGLLIFLAGMAWPAGSEDDRRR